MLRAGPLDGVAQVVGATEHRRLAVRNHVGGRGVGVEVAHREQPELGLRRESPLHVGADLAGPHDQRRHGDEPACSRPPLCPGQDQTACDHAESPEQPRPGHHRGGIGGRAEESGARDQRDRGKRGPGDQLADAVDEPGRDAVAVEPPAGEHRDHERWQQPDEPLTLGAGRADPEDQHQGVGRDQAQTARASLEQELGCAAAIGPPVGYRRGVPRHIGRGASRRAGFRNVPLHVPLTY